ncbi:uncharacterized protein LOC144700410 [Wolffia australiana]
MIDELENELGSRGCGVSGEPNCSSSSCQGRTTVDPKYGQDILNLDRGKEKKGIVLTSGGHSSDEKQMTAAKMSKAEKYESKRRLKGEEKFSVEEIENELGATHRVSGQMNCSPSHSQDRNTVQPSSGSPFFARFDSKLFSSSILSLFCISLYPTFSLHHVDLFIVVLAVVAGVINNAVKAVEAENGTGDSRQGEGMEDCIPDATLPVRSSPMSRGLSLSSFICSGESLYSKTTWLF